MDLSKVNKINYASDPRNFAKEESGKCVGKWQEWQSRPNPNFDPTKPYFIVCGDAGGKLPYFVVIDLDIITAAKLVDDEKKDPKRQKYKWLPIDTRKKIQACGVFLPPEQLLPKFLAEMGLPIETAVIRSGSGGLHLYYFVGDKGKILSNKSIRRFYENLAVDFRAGGGLIYGIGTWWKDYPAPYAILHDKAIMNVEGWRAAYTVGMLNYGVCGVLIEDFLMGRLDVHATNLGPEKEFIVWRETMYILKGLGYDQKGVFQIFSHLPGFKEKISEAQIPAWWDKEENDSKRVRAKQLHPGEKAPETADESRELDVERLFDELEETADKMARNKIVGQILRKQAKTNDRLMDGEIVARLKEITGIGKTVLDNELKSYRKDGGADPIEIMQTIHNNILNEYKLKYDVPTEQLRVWDGHAWVLQGEALVETYFKRKWLENTGNLPETGQYTNLLKNICVDERVSWRHPANESIWNMSEFDIPFQNGYVNVLTRAVVPPDPSKFFTYYIHEDYVPNAVCPDTILFLKEVLSDEDIETVQRYAGYTLVAYVKLKKCIVFLGPHNSGKSTVIDIFRYAIGRELSGELPPQKFGDKFAEAILEGKLFGFYNDLEKDMVKNIGRFKVAIDSTDLNYEDKHIKAHMSRNVTHHWYAGNVLPKIPEQEGADSINAFLERIMLLMCNKQQWEGEKKDVADILVKKERQGILAWMVEGAFKLFVEKGNFKHTQQHTLLEWLAGSIAVARFFKDQYVYDSTGKVLASDLYEECNNWLRAHSEVQYATDGAFGKEIRLLGLQHKRFTTMGKKDAKYKYYYVGLKKKPAEPEPVEPAEEMDATQATILPPPDEIVRIQTIVEQVASRNKEAAEMLAKQRANPAEISINNVYDLLVEKGMIKEGVKI